MSEHVPAWKKIGLVQKKVKSETQDPLKENIKRTAEQSELSGPKKPPKRAKKPKADRAPPPEPDQLAYLRKFHEDKENWKFSKQKQNWLLKNLFVIDTKYEEALQSYFGDIKGLSRDRLIDSAQEVIDKWNEFMIQPLEKPEDEAATDASKNAEEATEPVDDSNPGDNDKSKPKAKKQKQKPEPAKPAPPTEEGSRRAQWFVEKLTGTKPALELLE